MKSSLIKWMRLVLVSPLIAIAWVLLLLANVISGQKLWIGED
jgi:hypothetical protein